MGHTIEKIRDDFAFHLERERNLSMHTIRAYLGDLDSLIEHLKTLKVADLSELKLAHIRSWLANQQVKGGARTTLSRRAVSIRIFTKWAHKKGHLTSDVGISLATPKGHRTLPEVLTVADASLAMDALEVRVGEEDGPLAARDLAILEVLYATGARVSELCGLDFSDVDYSRNTIRVLGKGNKERTIPLGNPAMKALDAWIKSARPLIASEKSGTAVFLELAENVLISALCARLSMKLFLHSKASSGWDHMDSGIRLRLIY